MIAVAPLHLGIAGRCGVVAGGATLGVCQLIFGSARSPILRTLVALLYSPPAYAGYHVVFGLASYGVPSDMWRQVFAVVGALAIGVTAIARLAAFHLADGRS
jgi:hypothetical protein